MRTLIAVLFALLLAACAGYRGGWASVAYVGDKVPTEVGAFPSDLGVPDTELRVSLNNLQRTYDYQVWFFAVPVAVDPRTVMSEDHVGKLRVRLSVAPKTPGWVFRPGEARITIDGRTFTAVRGTRFAQWNEAGQVVKDGGRYDSRDVGAEFALEPSSRYQLTLEFDAPVPEPEKAQLSLDLSSALRAAGQPAVPPVKFAPVRWKHGYT